MPHENEVNHSNGLMRSIILMVAITFGDAPAFYSDASKASGVGEIKACA